MALSALERTAGLAILKKMVTSGINASQVTIVQDKIVDMLTKKIWITNMPQIIQTDKDINQDNK